MKKSPAGVAVTPLLTAPCARQVRPLCELFDTELPFNRAPLHEKIMDMASGKLCGGLPGHLLLDQRLADLHPASW